MEAAHLWSEVLRVTHTLHRATDENKERGYADATLVDQLASDTARLHILLSELRSHITSSATKASTSFASDSSSARMAPFHLQPSLPTPHRRSVDSQRSGEMIDTLPSVRTILSQHTDIEESTRAPSIASSGHGLDHLSAIALSPHGGGEPRSSASFPLDSLSARHSSADLSSQGSAGRHHSYPDIASHHHVSPFLFAQHDRARSLPLSSAPMIRHGFPHHAHLHHHHSHLLQQPQPQQPQQPQQQQQQQQHQEEQQQQQHPSPTTAGNSSFRRFCLECGVSQSPEWRRGPRGPRTLCNA
eukprot:CAMPEP_0177663918 /NCGR_PEP_ID=MMETSP0447-20121125/20187_1 /TAXON_ID=0 /ORGANISM="Stygamoeba regulata, Strain BSH-02190019" /LENGTH=299 /DNA_ID=CAMNT_0019169797 /DNA_START=222 /DNA_END=1117 /DNA_ORIENTATION=-